MRADVMDTSLGMRGVKHSPARRVKELEQQKHFLQLYEVAPTAYGATHDVFDFCTDYAAHLPLSWWRRWAMTYTIMLHCAYYGQGTHNHTNCVHGL